jgi:hypothetical protein
MNNKSHSFFLVGPMFAKLKGGHPVVLSDGTEIQPDQVVDEAVPGRYLAIICCIEMDDQTVLEDLITQEMFRRYISCPCNSWLSLILYDYLKQISWSRKLV